MTPCKVEWCVALSKKKGGACSVHLKHEGFRCDDAPPAAKPSCVWCDDTGECEHCEGSGLHKCECGDEHECSHCDGSGKCDMCKGRSKKAPPRPLDWSYVPPSLEREWHEMAFGAIQ